MPRVGCGLLLLAATLPAQQYPIVPIPNSPKNIEHIVEDGQGRLWIATHDDVLAFDGVRFFSLRDLGLPPLFPMSLAVDDDGGILICSNHGVHRYARGHVESIVTGLFAHDAIAVAPGVLLVTASDTEVPPFAAYDVRLVAGHWRAQRLLGWKTGMHPTRDAAGTMLFASPGGWCEIPAQTIMKASPSSPPSPLFHESGLDFARVVRDRYGCLWFRSAETSAYQCPADPDPKPLPASIAGRNVWSGVSESADGSMLIASADSLAMGRPGSFQQASPSNGLPAETVSSAIRARDGTIWIGTSAGLYRFAYPFRLTYWKSRHGLNWSFARSADAVFAGTSAGVDRLNEAGEWIPAPGSREFGSVNALMPRPDQSVYAAITAKGVAQLRSDGTIAAFAAVGQGRTVEALARDAEGSVWAGGSGLYRLLKRYSDIALEPYALPIGLRAPVFIASDLSGVIWGCSSGLLLRRQESVWRIVARAGVPQGLCRGLAFEPGGDVWAGYNTGLALIHPEQNDTAILRTFQPGRNFGGPSTFALAMDGRGWLWRGSGDGMHVADSSQARAGVWQHINQTDDIADPGVNHGSFFADRDGSVWWAAATSVVHFLPPSDLLYPAGAPRVFLSAFPTQAPRRGLLTHSTTWQAATRLCFISGHWNLRRVTPCACATDCFPPRKIGARRRDWSLILGSLAGEIIRSKWRAGSPRAIGRPRLDTTLSSCGLGGSRGRPCSPSWESALAAP